MRKLNNLREANSFACTIDTPRYRNRSDRQKTPQMEELFTRRKLTCIIFGNLIFIYPSRYLIQNVSNKKKAEIFSRDQTLQSTDGKERFRDIGRFDLQELA